MVVVLIVLIIIFLMRLFGTWFGVFRIFGILGILGILRTLRVGLVIFLLLFLGVQRIISATTIIGRIKFCAIEFFFS